MRHAIVICPIAVFLVGGLVLSAACIDEEDELERLSSSGDFGKFMAGCTRVDLTFSGQIFFKSPGRARQPLLDASVLCDGPWHEPGPCEVRIGPDGSFVGTAEAWDHVYTTWKKDGTPKHRYSMGRAWVSVSADGCKPKEFTVRKEWKHRRIVLKCPDRVSEMKGQSN